MGYAREKWEAIKALRVVGVKIPYEAAPPKKSVSATHRRKMHDSTRAKRARADRAEKLNA